MPMFKHFAQPLSGTFTAVSKAMSSWHDSRVPVDNLGGYVLLRIISSKVGPTQAGLFAFCSAKLWLFPRMEISQLFQQANLLQHCTTYHPPQMATTEVMHSSQKFSSCALCGSPVLRIQPPAPSCWPQEVETPGDWHVNTTTKEISQVGTEENIPDHWWHLKMCTGWIHCVWFPPSLPTSGADGADSEAGAVYVSLAEGLWVRQPQRDLCLQPVPPADLWLFKISCDPSCI